MIGRRLDVGSLGEQPEWYVAEDYEIGKYSEPCPHVVNLRVPRAIIVETQGGCDYTVLCVACAREALT